MNPESQNSPEARRLRQKLWFDPGTRVYKLKGPVPENSDLFLRISSASNSVQESQNLCNQVKSNKPDILRSCPGLGPVRLQYRDLFKARDSLFEK